MVIVLTAVGPPIAVSAQIWPSTGFLDRMRATVNVYGDTIGAGVIDHIVR
jgi:Na+/H+-dicarboxylate symporter